MEALVYLATQHDESSYLSFLFPEAKSTAGLFRRLTADLGQRSSRKWPRSVRPAAWTHPPVSLPPRHQLHSALRRSQKETALSDDDVESYELPSHQLEVPVVLVQDSIA